MRLRCVFTLVVATLATSAFGQRPVTFPLTNGQGLIQADVYGRGGHGKSATGVVLAHGGQFDKTSWQKQAQALAHSGFLVLALRFRGDALNPDGSPGTFGSSADNANDVLAAVAYLHRIGVTTISAVGASLGGDAVGDANARSTPGSIARIVILGSSGGDSPQKLTGRKLFIVSREDRSGSGLRLPEILAHYDRALQPKRLVILEGSAHAQYVFTTKEGPRLLNEILRFLSEP